ADDDLEHILTGDLAHGGDIARRRWGGDERFELGQIDRIGEVVLGPVVGDQSGEVLPAVAGFEVVADRVIGGGGGGGGAGVGARVRDYVSGHGREVLETLPVVFDDLAGPALDSVPAQHLEDDVLGRDPVRHLTGEF